MNYISGAVKHIVFKAGLQIAAGVALYFVSPPFGNALAAHAVAVAVCEAGAAWKAFQYAMKTYGNVET